jgi:hypothetical protein
MNVKLHVGVGVGVGVTVAVKLELSPLLTQRAPSSYQPPERHAIQLFSNTRMQPFSQFTTFTLRNATSYFMICISPPSPGTESRRSEGYCWMDSKAMHACMHAEHQPMELRSRVLGNKTPPRCDWIFISHI